MRVIPGYASLPACQRQQFVFERRKARWKRCVPRSFEENAMRYPKVFSAILLVPLFLVPALFAQAQGVIVPGPCERCPRPPRPIPLPRSLPVKSIKIDTKIVAQVATTHLEQIFRNDTDLTLEGTYFFPLPES